MIMEIVRNNKNTLKWITLEEEGCSIIEESKFRFFVPTILDYSTLVENENYISSRFLHYQAAHRRSINPNSQGGFCSEG